MTDARLLSNPNLLLLWSASLEYEVQTFDEWFARYQTEGEEDAEIGAACSPGDAEGFSVRVAERTLATAG